MLTHFNYSEMCDIGSRHSCWTVGEVDVFALPIASGWVLAIPGTETNLWPFEKSNFKEAVSNWRDVLRDLRFAPVWRDKIGVAHAGFMKGAIRWADKFEPRLEGKPIHGITGHSMGGAIAYFLASTLAHRDYQVGEVVTFGAPKPMYGCAKRRYLKLDIPTTAYRLNFDPITYVPPWGRSPVQYTKLKLDVGKTRESHKIYNYSACLRG
jgi:hypothetical protein